MDVPIDYRFLDVLLRSADDPEIGLGQYAQGVKVGPGTRMPRLPALFEAKKKWRLPSQVDPLDYLGTKLEFGGATIRPYVNSRRRFWMSCTIKLQEARS